LDQSRITVEATFPSKHWAGRLGNWTPSLTWAPDQHDDLIQYRKIQLDVWLVHVVYLYNQQQQLPSTNSKQFTSSSSASYLPQIVQNAIYDFLQPAQKLPCDQIHDWALASPQNNSSSTTLKSLWEQAKWNNPLSFTLGSSIRQAVTTIHYMCHSSCSQQQRHNDYIVHNNNNNDDDYYSQQQQRWQESDASIPLDLLHAAKGLMFLTVVKAGLVVSGRLGTGLIVAKLDEESLPIGTPTHHRPTSPDATTTSTSTSRWSAPCALGTLGMGWGALAGGDVTHYLIVFTSQKAVQAMVGGSSVQFGAEVDVAVGPMGRGATSHVSASHHDWSLHPAYAYAHSQGFFAGISLEGSFVAVRPEVNAKFYGQATTDALAILQRPGVNAAVPLYQALDQALGLDIPSRGIRPSQIWSSPPTAWSVPPTPTQQHCHQQPNGPFMSSPIMSPSVPGTFNNMITSTMSTPVQSNGNYNAHSQWNAHTI
jgi:lipid-binding SYLF domain-containing protein